MNKKYTVSEIDALRHVLECKFLYGTYRMGVSSWSRAFKEDEKVKAVEEMVRTHMRAGHTADDLLASEKLDTAANS